MDDESVRETIQKFCRVAVDMGFITEKQMEEALDEQIANDPFSRLRPHRLIGDILLERGWMNSGQVEAVLEKLKK